MNLMDNTQVMKRMSGRLKLNILFKLLTVILNTIEFGIIPILRIRNKT